MSDLIGRIITHFSDGGVQEKPNGYKLPLQRDLPRIMTTGGFPRCMKIRLTYSENSRKQGHNFPYWYTSGSVSSRHTGTKITFGVSNFNVSTFNLCGVI